MKSTLMSVHQTLVQDWVQRSALILWIIIIVSANGDSLARPVSLISTNVYLSLVETVVYVKTAQGSTPVSAKRGILEKIVSAKSIPAGIDLVKMVALVKASKAVTNVTVSEECMDNSVNGIRMTAYLILVRMVVHVWMAMIAIPVIAQKVSLGLIVNRL